MLGARRTSARLDASSVEARAGVPPLPPPPLEHRQGPRDVGDVAGGHLGREPPRRGLERLARGGARLELEGDVRPERVRDVAGKEDFVTLRPPRVGDSRLQRPRRAWARRASERGVAPEDVRHRLRRRSPAALGRDAPLDASVDRAPRRLARVPRGGREGPAHDAELPRVGGVEGSLARDGGVHRAPRFLAELPPERRERPDEVRDRNRRNRGGTGERAAPNPRLERGQNPAERGRNRARGRREGRSGGRRGVIRGVIRRRATTRRGRENAALRRTIRRARNIRRSLRISLPLAPRPRPREFRDGVRDGRGRARVESAVFAHRARLGAEPPKRRRRREVAPESTRLRRAANEPSERDERRRDVNPIERRGGRLGGRLGGSVGVRERERSREDVEEVLERLRVGDGRRQPRRGPGRRRYHRRPGSRRSLPARRTLARRGGGREGRFRVRGARVAESVEAEERVGALSESDILLAPVDPQDGEVTEAPALVAPDDERAHARAHLLLRSRVEAKRVEHHGVLERRVEGRPREDLGEVIHELARGGEGAPRHPAERDGRPEIRGRVRAVRSAARARAEVRRDEPASAGRRPAGGGGDDGRGEGRARTRRRRPRTRALEKRRRPRDRGRRATTNRARGKRAASVYRRRTRSRGRDAPVRRARQARRHPAGDDTALGGAGVRMENPRRSAENNERARADDICPTTRAWALLRACLGRIRSAG